MAPYILLGFFIAGLLQVFVNRRTMARHLSGRGWKPVIKAALFGIPLPLCSCGVLPTAVALRRRGASKGATTSFLIATPQTGVDSIAATYSLLTPAFAVIRPVAALVGAVFGGMAVSKLGDEDTADSEIKDDVAEEPEITGGFWTKMLAAVKYGFVDMVASVGGWLVIGLLVAALITVFVPDELFVSLSRYPLVAMLAVVVVAIPMYVCATGSIPIAMSLMMKGLSPGIAFVMLMAGPAANFASIVILSKTQGRKATAIYVGSVVLTALAFGLAIDLLFPTQWFVPGMHGAHCHGESANWFSTVCALLLGGLLVYTQIINRKHHHHHNIEEEMTQKFKIMGMNCPHCQASVQRAIASVAGVESVDVDLKGACATVNGSADSAAVIEAVKLAGFDASL
ncbi:MAG: permease [Bacteroides sp.]|nr:permease [Bacteroides sp.]